MSALRAFAEALFSTPAGPPPPDRIDWVSREMEDYLVRAGSRARWIFRLSLFALMWGAPLFVGALPTLRRLPVARRIEALTKMEESFIAAPVLAVKAFLCVVWYEHPDVQREVGYVGRATFPMALPGTSLPSAAGERAP